MQPLAKQCIPSPEVKLTILESLMHTNHLQNYTLFSIKDYIYSVSDLAHIIIYDSVDLTQDTNTPYHCLQIKCTTNS